jgi:hypothetical protein
MWNARALSNSVEFPPYAYFIRHCYNVHYFNKIMKQSALLILFLLDLTSFRRTDEI